MFARLGEQTGQLPLMLQRAATLHRSAAPRHATGHHPGAAADRGMGLIVMLIVLAVLQPIIELNQLREITPRQKNRTMAVTLDDKLVVAISSRAV
jgi:type II secretory pathway component PulF